MFTLENTFEQIMNTEPVGRAIGNLFPTCWRNCISPERTRYPMSRIAKEDKMDWDVPFPSDAFVKTKFRAAL